MMVTSVFPLIQYVCGVGVFYEIQCLLLLLGLHKNVVTPGARGLKEHLKNPGSTDLFGSSDAIVKHVLEVCTYICVDINFCGCKFCWLNFCVKIIFVTHLCNKNCKI